VLHEHLTLKTYLMDEFDNFTC